jgi:hypothetical protein
MTFNYPDGLPVDVCETHTFCAGIDLLVRGIHTQQLDEHTLLFERESDVTYALMLLSASTVYTVSV